MSGSITVSQVTALAAQLSPEERRQLAESILLELAALPRPPRRRAWREIRGCVAHSLVGEDAQAWVIRSRRKQDERRGTYLAGHEIRH